ncbi:MAG: hypothetical protein QM775_23680 [Pirellulales bacterium]
MSKRPKAGGGATGVQLFPFLAVLLCTMGALILLLMLLAQQARSQVAAETKAKSLAAHAEVDNAELERKRDELQWRIDQLQAAHDKTEAEVAKHRDQLSHVEEHYQRLRKQLDDLEAAQKLLASQSGGGDADKAALEAQLADLRAKVAEAKLRLEQAKAAGQKPQAFAVVPYDGANGTRRRPIYIECRGDSVVLQPEGVVFREIDFAGSLGPSNPLASCVRVVSEYITRGNNYADGEQPYPLLLVRPSGIGAYYAARAAMQSWDSDFGYELVNEDWPLEFPPADPLLGQMLAKTVEEARVRQAMIARAAPALRKSRGAAAPSFQMASGGGGFDQGSGSGGAGEPGGSGAAGGRGSRAPAIDAGYSSMRDTPTGSGLGTTASPGGALPGTPGYGGTGNNGTGNNGIGLGGSGPGGAGFGAPQLAQSGGGAGNQLGTGTGMPGTMGTGASGNGDGPWLGAPATGTPTNGNGGDGQGSPTDGTGGNGSGSPGGPPSTVGSRYAGGTSSEPGTGEYTGGASQGAPGYGPLAGNGSSGYGSAANAASGNSGGTATSGVPGGGGASSTGGASSSMGGMASSAGGGSSSGGSSGGGGGVGSPSSAAVAGEPQMPSVAMGVPAGPGQYVEPMSRKRGKDWGLPEVAARSTPLTRPIQLYMSADQVTLFSDRGIPDKQVQFGATTEESVDTLVSQVWDHVKGWGLAGRGMYWKPILSVHVAPDGTARFNELKQLLTGSGLEVTGKQISVAAPSGPVRR